MGDYYGKYRGEVVDNEDPVGKARLEVNVPAVYGDGTTNWAMPCVPYAGANVGTFLLPPVGASVWVEFEGGDPDYPIWTGCFWGDEENPARGMHADAKLFKTKGVTVRIPADPNEGGLLLELGPPLLPATQSIVIGASDGEE